MRKLFIVAGESSGDLHGSALTAELLRQDPTLSIKALGGPLMQKAGAQLVADLTGHAVVGLFEGIRNVGRIYATYRETVRLLKKDRPDAVVLIDYPEFNLRLARRAKKLGITVIYYISPQVWAWRRWRVRNIRKYVDKMLVIFPFEEGFFRERGVEAEFVGHPLVEALSDFPDRQTARAELQLPPDGLVVGLLPGSRSKEFEAIFPLLVESAKKMVDRLEFPITFVCARAPAIENHLVDNHLASGVPVKMVSGKTYQVMRSSDLLLAASGTVTVEAMILAAPMIVVYKVSKLTYAMLIRFIKVSRYAMVNIIAGRQVVPELIQKNATAERIAGEALALIRGKRLPEMADDLRAVTELLKSPGKARVTTTVAERILQTIEGRN